MERVASHEGKAVSLPTIVDHGRGPQLSTCKVTVQDLLPAFKAGQSDVEILAWYPQLSAEEVRLLRQYYLDHSAEVLEAEARIAAYHDELRQLYHRASPLAFAILSRELGVPDALRFFGQFGLGEGNYTEERRQPFAGLTMEEYRKGVEALAKQTKSQTAGSDAKQ